MRRHLRQGFSLLGRRLAIQCVGFMVTLLYLCLFPSAASADTLPSSVAMSDLLKRGLEELVELDVTLATGTPKPLNLVPSVASVITAKDIEDMGATSLDEVLETVPGLHVQHSATNTFSSIWNLRGINTQFNPEVLLLMNGQPVRVSSYGTRPQTFRMPVSMISRIEIIRGPGSAMLGADAFAGAINIITKDNSDINGSALGGRGGSFGSYDLWAQKGGTLNGWEYALGTEYTKGNGDRHRIISKDALGSGPPSLAPGPLETHYDILDTHLLIRKNNLAFRLYYNEIFDDGQGAGISQVLSDRSYSKNRLIMGTLAYHEDGVLPDLDLTAMLSGSYNRLENIYYFFPPAYRNQIGNPGVVEQNGGLELSGDYRGIARHLLRLVAGMSNYNADPFQKKNYGPGITDQFGPLIDITNTPYVFMTDQHRAVLYAAVQDVWHLAPRWELTAGLRLDHYTDVGDTLNPRLALVWAATPELTAKLLYGRAFRPPTFGELHFQNNPVQRGNSELAPETINTLELALDYKPLSTLRLGLNLFDYKIHGLIDYVPDPAPATTRTARNARDQEGRGFEVEADWMVTENVRLRGNFAYQRSKDRKTGDVVPDSPAMKFYGNVHWKVMDEWSVDAQYFRVGDRRRAAGDPRPKIADYDLVNLTIRKKNIARHWDLAFAVRNLFDRDIREPAPIAVPDDYPMEHRSFWAEVRYRF